MGDEEEEEDREEGETYSSGLALLLKAKRPKTTGGSYPPPSPLNLTGAGWSVGKGGGIGEGAGCLLEGAPWCRGRLARYAEAKERVRVEAWRRWM